jgi:hypothetical protein
MEFNSAFKVLNHNQGVRSLCFAKLLYWYYVGTIVIYFNVKILTF